MSLPGVQDFMLPIVSLLARTQELSRFELTEALIRELNIGESEQAERLPSGSKKRLNNRVSWASTHLKKAGLIEAHSRGRYRITSRGREILAGRPERIDVRLLNQFPEYVGFRNYSRPDEPSATEVVQIEPVIGTPDEGLDASYQNLRRELADDLLRRVMIAPPRFFEQLVVDLLVAMGYGGSKADAGRAVGQTGDGGIDGIIKEDMLGLDAVYLQAKRWEATVGRPEVQAFAGSLEGHRARKGVFITTSRFSREAEDYVGRIEKKIVLITGEQLTQYMIDFGIGVAVVETYVVKRVDADYFEDA